MDTEHTTKTTIKIGHLDSRPAIREELAKVYRAMRRGEVDCADGTRLCYVLQILNKMLEEPSFIDLSALPGLVNGPGTHDDVR